MFLLLHLFLWDIWLINLKKYIDNINKINYQINEVNKNKINEIKSFENKETLKKIIF